MFIEFMSQTRRVQGLVVSLGNIVRVDKAQEIEAIPREEGGVPLLLFR